MVKFDMGVLMTMVKAMDRNVKGINNKYGLSLLTSQDTDYPRLTVVLHLSDIVASNNNISIILDAVEMYQKYSDMFMMESVGYSIGDKNLLQDVGLFDDVQTIIQEEFKMKKVNMDVIMTMIKAMNRRVTEINPKYKFSLFSSRTMHHPIASIFLGTGGPFGFNDIVLVKDVRDFYEKYSDMFMADSVGYSIGDKNLLQDVGLTDKVKVHIFRKDGIPIDYVIEGVNRLIPEVSLKKVENDHSTPYVSLVFNGNQASTTKNISITDLGYIIHRNNHKYNINNEKSLFLTIITEISESPTSIDFDNSGNMNSIKIADGEDK